MQNNAKIQEIQDTKINTAKYKTGQNYKTLEEIKDHCMCVYLYSV